MSNRYRYYKPTETTFGTPFSPCSLIHKWKWNFADVAAFWLAEIRHHDKRMIYPNLDNADAQRRELAASYFARYAGESLPHFESSNLP